MPNFDGFGTVNR